GRGNGTGNFIFRGLRPHDSLSRCGSAWCGSAWSQVVALPRSAEGIAVRAETRVGINRKLFMAVGGAAFVGGAVPGAAAQNSHFPRRRALRIVAGTLRIITFSVEIVAPLPHIAVHVVEAPAVGQLLSHRPRHSPRVPLEPGVARQFRL